MCESRFFFDSNSSSKYQVWLYSTYVIYYKSISRCGSTAVSSLCPLLLLLLHLIRFPKEFLSSTWKTHFTFVEHHSCFRFVFYFSSWSGLVSSLAVTANLTCLHLVFFPTKNSPPRIVSGKSVCSPTCPFLRGGRESCLLAQALSECQNHSLKFF